MTFANDQPFQSSRIRTKTVLYVRRTALTHTWFLWNVKEPTPLFEKSRGRRPSGVVNLHTTHHIIHIMGWSGCQWRLCMLTSELTVYMFFFFSFFFLFFFFFFFFFFILVVKKKASNEFCLFGEWECGNLSFCVKGRERMVFSLDVTRKRIGSLR